MHALTNPNEEHPEDSDIKSADQTLHSNEPADGSRGPFKAIKQFGRGYVSLILASAATGLSLSISAMVGWQYGATTAAHAVMAALGIVSVLGAHLLPMQCRAASWPIRVIGVPIWLACLTYTAYGHGSFFIEALRQAGDHRVSAMDAATTAPGQPRRSLPDILTEQAGLRPKLLQTRLTLAACETGCDALKVRQLAQQAKVVALEAEETEARRWQSMQDLTQQRRDALRTDPVATRILPILGVTPDTGFAVTVFLVAVILEGLGSLCWLLFFERRRLASLCQARAVSDCPVSPSALEECVIAGRVSVTNASLVEPCGAHGTSERASIVEADGDAVGRSNDAHGLATEVWPLIVAGKVKPTVTGIRNHLRIGQDRARAVRAIVSIWRRADVVSGCPPE